MVVDIIANVIVGTIVVVVDRIVVVVVVIEVLDVVVIALCMHKHNGGRYYGPT